MKPLLIRHLEGEKIGRFPVWMMRQAGRYLDSYQAIRRKHSFWEMVSTPSLAAEVSLLPLRELPVDAVIFFSDILTLPYSLGIPVEMQEAVGPVVTDPLRTVGRFEIFSKFDPHRHAGYVGEALTRIRKETTEQTALLGFAGAPWTVAAYLVEGKAPRHFEQMKAWYFEDEAGFGTALRLLAEATLKHLLYQAEKGAHAVQLFDTWLGEMPRAYFTQTYSGILNLIFDGLRAKGVKSIFYTKNAHHLDEELVRLHCDVMSVDPLLSLKEMEKRTASRFHLQGNLDPILLQNGSEASAHKLTQALVAEARSLSKPAIMNLGHGLLPKTPVANVRAFLEEARAIWR